MDDPPQIKDLPAVIQPYLGDREIISYTSRYLTKPGDNYGSLMLSITAKVKNPNGTIEELPLVAKIPPVTNDFAWKMFKPERTCLTENTVYKNLTSEIRKLQLEAGINEADLFDSFAKCYGARSSLDPNTEIVDRDAVLVQENLQTSGYKAGDRHTMFDLPAASLIMAELAKFHALPLALRLRKPEVFDRKVRPYFGRFNMHASLNEEEKSVMTNALYADVRKATDNNEQILDRVNAVMEKFMQHAESPDTPDGPFVSIAHFDLWINNIMLKYDESGAPRHLKFVDFQVAQIDHVAQDIIFFLFSSVDTKVLEQNYYQLLELYYEEFIKCLKSVGVPIEKYSYKNFLEEVRTMGSTRVWQALFMTVIILANKDDMPDDFKDMNMDTMDKLQGNSDITQRVGDILRLADKFNLF